MPLVTEMPPLEFGEGVRISADRKEFLLQFILLTILITFGLEI